MKLITLLIVCLCYTGIIFGQDTVITNIKFLSGTNTLYGQISIPKNMKNVPLIIFLPGSGDTSYRTDYKVFLGQTIEGAFKKDFALLYFDKPGIGQSTGEWWKQNFYEQAENSLNALKYAIKNFPINKSNVGIIGHSQGGWLAQIVAAKYPNEFKFGISMAGPAVSVLEQFAETENSRFLCEGLDSIAAREKAFQNSKAVQNSDLEWLKSTDYGLGDKDLSNIKIIKDYDPRPEIKKIKIPFLFVYGEKDEYVYPTESIESLKSLFSGEIPQNISAIVIPKADHTFHIKEKCFDGDRKSLKFSDVLNPQMKSWVEQVLKINKK